MKLLVVSARSPFETVSGAAHSQRAVLAGLARRGCACEVLSAAPVGSTGPAWRAAGEVRHAVVEPGALVDAAAAAIAGRTPDVVMIWGGRDLAAAIVERAAAHGVPTAHQIDTPSRYHVERLGWDGSAAVDADERAGLPAGRRADLILVPSAFMADYWAARLGTRPAVVHPVAVARRVRTPRRGARFVTFINPEPGKGLGVFWRLASEAAERIPRARFLVVEGRWGAARLAEVGFAAGALANVRIVAHQPDVRRIWARTQVLLVPSVMPEAFGLVVQEAQLNGIPVIASRIAGLPEAANGGGVLVAPPRRCVADWARVPSAAEIQPWLDALAPLVADRAARARARRRALRAATGFAPARILDELADRLRALAGARRRSRGPARR